MRQPDLRSIGRSGFTAIETILTIVILSFVGIMASRVVMNSNVTMLQSMRSSRSNALADAVLERYNSYALTSFHALHTFNQNDVEPKTFFGTADNMGYDNMKLTTAAQFNANRTACQVKVVVTWNEGNRARAQTFAKNYNETPSYKGGGVVEATVKTCPTCPGAGFIVSAPAAAGALNVVGVTDANGHVFLKGVRTGDTIAVTATSPGSAYNEVSFVQGYYVPATLPDGTPSGSKDIQKTIDVTEAGPNVIAFDEFRPLSHVMAQIVNADAGGENPMVYTDFVARLSMVALRPDGSFSPCDMNSCSVSPDGAGRIVLRNVVPGPVRLTAEKAGSQPGETPLRWGYTTQGDSVNLNLPAGALGVPTEQAVDLPVRRLGWLTVEARDSGSGAVVPNTKVTAFVNDKTYEGTTDTSGRATFHNVFKTDAGSWRVNAIRFPSSSVSGLYYFQPVSLAGTGLLGTEKFISVSMTSGLKLRGRIVEGGTPLTNGTITFYIPGGELPAGLDADGRFELSGFPPGQFGPDSNGNPRWIMAKVHKTLSAPITGTVKGRVSEWFKEGQWGLPAPHVPLTIWSWAPCELISSRYHLPVPYDSYAGSNEYGDYEFTVQTSTGSHYRNDLWANCDYTMGECQLLDNGGATDVSFAPSVRGDCWFGGATGETGWLAHGTNTVGLIKDSVTTYNMQAELWTFPVSGFTRNVALEPIEGITVGSDASSADGSYLASVRRLDNSRDANSPGTGKLSVAEQTVGGVAYAAANHDVTFPVTSSYSSQVAPNPLVDPPVQVNFTLPYKNGGQSDL